MKLKLLNLNLLHGGLIDGMFDFLKKENADIMTLQEVVDSKNMEYPRNFRCLDELIKLFPDYQYDFISQAHWFYEGKEVELGIAIFSRFPIRKKANKFFDYPYSDRYVEEEQNGDFRDFPRNIQSAEIEINGKILNVFNVHGVWGFDGADNLERDNMSKIIIEHIRYKENVILAGDTNTWPETKAISNIRNLLVDPFEGKITTTFNIKFKPSTFIPKIVDILFVSRDIKVSNSYMPMDDVSDHRPLVCEIEI